MNTLYNMYVVYYVIYITLYIKVFGFRRYKRYKVSFSLRYEAKRCNACAFLGVTPALQTPIKRYKPPASAPSLRTYGG